MSRVFVVGVGMTKFLKPREGNPDYPQMTRQAINRALMDANVSYKEIEHAVVGYVYGLSATGQRAVYEGYLSGIPITNVNNNCATGSTALYVAANVIRGGQAECALAVGFDKMEPGPLKMDAYSDRASPLEYHMTKTKEFRGLENKVPFAPRIFGNAGLEHMEKYGTKEDHFVKIAYKNHEHSSKNPYAQFQKVYTMDEIRNSDRVHGPLTKLQCCPTSDGAGAAILASENFVLKHNLQDQAVEILATVMTTDSKESFQTAVGVAGGDMSKRAANIIYSKTGVKPHEVDVCELHDCFSANELVTYEALGFAPEGKAGQFIDNDWKVNGKQIVINPSGGLISKGHPLGATGLAQCAELCWQLRGMAEKRQVSYAKIALQHNIGLGGACVLTMYRKYNDKNGHTRPEQSSDPAVLEKYEKMYLEKDKQFWSNIPSQPIAPRAKATAPPKPRL